ncbi:MAG: DUF2254 domain-containing protein [bacterium]
MTGIWTWNFQQLRKRIWFPIAIFGVLGVLTAFAAVWLKPLVPPDLPRLIGSESVSTLLNILATSMLAVTTFSVSIMVSAFNAAANNATPRATVLLRDDGVTQGVLASFTGAFIYSLCGIIGLQTGIYQRSGRLVLFVVTIVVLAIIIWQLVHWIGHLSNYGRLTDITDRLETAATKSLAKQMKQPYLGGLRPEPDLAARLATGTALPAATIGYVQFVDMESLQSCAEKAGATIFVAALPGAFVDPQRDLLHLIGGTLTDDLAQSLRDAFVVDTQRTFDQDPRFGLIVLAEVASRALSPAINDPGTAIDILGRLQRILSLWHDQPDHEVLFDRIIVGGLVIDDLFADAFAPIARDGATLVEVQIRLQKVLHALARLNPDQFARPAAEQSRRALAFADTALVLAADRALVADLSRQIAP